MLKIIQKTNKSKTKHWHWNNHNAGILLQPATQKWIKKPHSHSNSMLLTKITFHCVVEKLKKIKNIERMELFL